MVCFWWKSRIQEETTVFVLFHQIILFHRFLEPTKIFMYIYTRTVVLCTEIIKKKVGRNYLIWYQQIIEVVWTDFLLNKQPSLIECQLYCVLLVCFFLTHYYFFFLCLCFCCRYYCCLFVCFFLLIIFLKLLLLVWWYFFFFLVLITVRSNIIQR